MIFYLGTHMPNWLADPNVPVPLFVSCRRLRTRKTLPKATHRWALDSGGFTELSMHGEWRTSPAAYAAEVRRYADEIGRLDWAAPQDWMCEPFMLAKTGLTVRQHQQRTVANYLELQQHLGDLVIPALQGWTLDDYLRCVDQYDRAGIDLTSYKTVGLGSVCRRQATGEAEAIVHALANLGVACHGFGMKTLGLRRYGGLLASSDSMAWSYNARKHQPLPGHTHKSCANCPVWALAWRRNVLAASPTRGFWAA